MYLLPDLMYPLLHVMSTYASPMGTHASPPSLDHVRAASSSGIHTKLTIDGCGDVNNMKIADPPDCSVPSAGLVHTPKPQTPSLQADVATLTEAKSTKRNHAYSRAGVIKPGAYSRSLIKSAKHQNLDCVGCNAVRSLGIDHCHKHDGDKYGKGPQKRLRR